MREVWVEACELREGDVIVGELFHYDGGMRELDPPGTPLEYFIDHRWEGELITLVYPKINSASGTMAFKTDVLDAPGVPRNSRRHTTPNSWLLVETDQ